MSNLRVLAVIPARFASSRFPGKPLADIGGTSMIERVYAQTKKASKVQDVVVATDDNRIFEVVQSFGGKVVMTSAEHPSGTDRCFEALEKSGSFDFVLNVQGDEPFISPDQIDLLIDVLGPGVELATLIKKITSEAEFLDSNEVKVALGANDEALYFSRSPIPFPYHGWNPDIDVYKHIGIYAYRSDILEAITKLPVSSLERTESLEQLRWMENGYRVHTAVTTFESMCIDTPEDIEEALKVYKL